MHDRIDYFKGQLPAWIILFALLFALVPSAYNLMAGIDVPQLGYFQDDALYWISAKSLADGNGYRIESLPEQPYQTKYPPLYPVLLSSIWKLWPHFPSNVPIAALVSWIALPLWLYLSWLFFRTLSYSHAASAAAIIVLGWTPAVVFLSVNLMAELWFCCFVLACLLLLERPLTSKNHAITVLAGALAGLAFLTKSAALPLIAAGIGVLFFRKRYVSAAFFTIGALPAVMAWHLWVHAHQYASNDPTLLYHTDYLKYYFVDKTLQDFPRMWITNLDALANGAGSLLAFWPAPPVGVGAVVRVIGLLALIGLARHMLYVGARAFHLFGALYVFQLLAWHFTPNERFLLPVFPFLLVGLVTEFRHVCRLGARVFADLRRRVLLAARAIPIVGVVVWMSGSLYGSFWHVPAIVQEHRSVRAASVRCYQWMKESLLNDTRVIAYFDPVVYLYTGLRGYRLGLGSMPFYRNDREGILRPFRAVDEFAEDHNVGYLVLTDQDYQTDLNWTDRSEMVRIIEESPALRLVYEGYGISVYEFRRGGLLREFAAPTIATGAAFSRRHAHGAQDVEHVPEHHDGKGVVHPPKNPGALHPQAQPREQKAEKLDGAQSDHRIAHPHHPAHEGAQFRASHAQAN